MPPVRTNKQPSDCCEITLYRIGSRFLDCRGVIDFARSTGDYAANIAEAMIDLELKGLPVTCHTARVKLSE